MGYLLIPGAILAGFSGSALWAGVRVYLRNLSAIHAKIKGFDPTKLSGMYYGVFYISNIAMLVGSGIASIINAAMGQSELAADVSLNQSDFSNRTLLEFSNNSCGISYDPSFGVKLTKNQIPTTNLRVIFSTFIGMQLLNCVILLFLDDSDILIRSFVVDNQNNLVSMEEDTIKAIDDEQQVNLTTKKSTHSCINTKAVLSMLSLIRKDKIALLVLPFTIHIGFMQSVIRGDFTRSWITCILGNFHRYNYLLIYF